MHKKLSANKLGISYLEILIMLLILGLITSFVIPSFLRKQGKSTKQLFCTEFSTLMQEALMDAIITEKIHQIFFDLDEKKITVKIHDPSQPSSNKHEKFAFIQLNSFSKPMNISPDLLFRNFYINGSDEFASGKDMHRMWFYIMPDGTSQSIIMNIEDIETTSQQNKFSIVINPFYSQVKEYDAFQKP